MNFGKLEDLFLIGCVLYGMLYFFKYAIQGSYYMMMIDLLFAYIIVYVIIRSSRKRRE